MEAEKAAEAERQRIAAANIVEEPKADRVIDIQLNLDNVKATLKYIVTIIKQTNAIAGTALEIATCQVVQNRCILTVADDVQADFLQKDKQRIVDELRARLQEPAIVLEIVVDTQMIIPVSNAPYTLEEKLRVMQEKNPVLLKLQEHFKTRIIS